MRSFLQKKQLRDYKGIIFDCDGVLVDSEPYSCFAWNVLFQRKFNIDIGKDYSDVLGKNGHDAAQHYCVQHQINFTEDMLEKLSKEKEEIYYELARNKLKSKPGVEDFIQKALDSGLKIAVASSGVLDKIEFSLQQTGLRKYFSIIVDTRQVQRGKPYPDLFLKAAELLSIPIQKCMIIEDSISGIEAGKASGAFTIGLVGTFPKINIKNADMTIESFQILLTEF